MHHFTAPVDKSVKHTALRNLYCGMSPKPLLSSPPPLQYGTPAEGKTDTHQGNFLMATNTHSSDFERRVY